LHERAYFELKNILTGLSMGQVISQVKWRKIYRQKKDYPKEVL